MVDDFDLLTRPWVNARTLDGTAESLGLSALLAHAHRLSDVEAPVPPGYGGLRHILAALTYRITGLDRQESASEWRRRRDLWLEHGTLASFPPELRPEGDDADPVSRYFDRLEVGRFSLFGPRPFLQDPRLREESETCGINKLVLGRPVGKNGATWWTRHHQGNQGAIPPHEAAWWLIVQWYYGAAGQITARTVYGSRSSSAKAGMLRNTITYYPRGQTLFDSLLLSLVPPAAALPDPASRPGPDLCPWEWEKLPDPAAPPRPPGGMCALLTGVHTHAMLLVPDEHGAVVDAYRTWAYRKPWPERKTENPFVSYERTKGTQRTADPARALWRDLDALLPETAKGATGRTVAASRYRPPRFLEERLNLSGRRAPSGLAAVGFRQDPMTTDHTWWLSSAPPEFTRLLDDDERTAAAVRRLLALLSAECEQELRPRLRRAWREGVRSGPKERLNKSWPQRGARRFWEQAEHLFFARLEAELVDSPADESAENQRTRHAARALCVRAYDEVTQTVMSDRGPAHPPSRIDLLLRRAVIKHRPHL
ncbi:hypothetical protein GCM10009799_14370 [Nocardiopsis rhodophaea]|uniref:Type I-E CRISPR-associated protein Cse1/CasA n=1 Tax=Nocardiopsis rhodophaea TaxID=280238 RepID=A0ABN2SNQ2_9ACTN